MSNPRTPTALKVIRGTDQPCRRNDKEPQTVAVKDLPDPPRGLPKEAKKAWRELGQKLVDSGVMTVVDVQAFEALVSCWVEWKHCRDFCFQNGYAYEKFGIDDEGNKISLGFKQYPQATHLNTAETRLRQWLNQFGMTPSSRAGIAAVRTGDQSSPWDNF